MLEDNPLQWPQIPALPKLFAQHVSAGLTEGWPGLLSWLAQPVEATVKYDGTNLGAGCDGRLYGRRKMVPDNAANYQQTPVAEARAADVAGLKAELARLVGGGPELRVVVYGELMCNKTLYSYARSGLAGRWIPFGAMLAADPAALDGLLPGLERAGLAYQEMEDPPGAIRLPNCPALRRLFGRAGLPVQEPLFAGGGLPSMCRSLREWMCAGQGEGVVLAGAFGLSKWKCSSEPQAGNIAKLRELQLSLDAHPGPVPGEVEQTLAVLQLVTTGGGLDKVSCALERQLSDDLTRLVRAKSQEQLAAHAPDLPLAEAVIDPVAVEEAVLSAATKFDSAEAYKARGLAAELVGLLCAEVEADLAIELVEGKGSRKEARACIKREVLRLVQPGQLGDSGTSYAAEPADEIEEDEHAFECELCGRQYSGLDDAVAHEEACGLRWHA